MKRTIDVTEPVYARLEGLAKGFDTPSDVITRLLDSYDDVRVSKSMFSGVSESKSMTNESVTNRTLVNSLQEAKAPQLEGSLKNSEIQMRISLALARKSQEEVDLFCDKQYSKSVFGLNFPLLVRLPTSSDYQTRRDAVKEKGVSRWTWKFSFTNGDFVYAICTQWFRSHDDAVRKWLMENEQM